MMLDCCEYCGKEMQPKDRKRYKNYFYHSICKEYQKFSEEITKERKSVS